MKIEVGHRTYTVRHWDAVEGAAHEAFGMISTNDSTIFVNTSKPAERIANSLIHEVLHAIWEEWALDEGESDEERIVKALANGLTQVLRGNKEFVAKVLADD